MMSLNNNQQAFFELLTAGLWDKEARLSKFGAINLKEICRIAEEQAVVGLVAAGLEHVTDVKLPKEVVLLIVGQTLQLEQRNKAMNAFVAELIGCLRDAGICTLLVKGQGIAQCYEKPLWRACGDIDLFLDDYNYKQAALLLSTIADRVDTENEMIKHLSMTIGSWEVELHGTLCSQIKNEVDNVLLELKDDTFQNSSKYRIWDNEGVDIYLPPIDDDIIFIFTHIYQHYFKEGIGLRQICDWCRLLWSYRNRIDLVLLETRLNRMHLLPVWRAFAALSVYYIGMPVDAIPFYSADKKWIRKADRILDLIFETGNFGHNRDMSYKHKHHIVISKFISFWLYFKYGIRQLLIFPVDAIKGWWRLMRLGIGVMIKGH